MVHLVRNRLAVIFVIINFIISNKTTFNQTLNNTGFQYAQDTLLPPQVTLLDRLRELGTQYQSLRKTPLPLNYALS